jgi:hypothetical protein
MPCGLGFGVKKGRSRVVWHRKIGCFSLIIRRLPWSDPRGDTGIPFSRPGLPCSRIPRSGDAAKQSGCPVVSAVANRFSARVASTQAGPFGPCNKGGVHICPEVCAGARFNTWMSWSCPITRRRAEARCGSPQGRCGTPRHAKGQRALLPMGSGRAVSQAR